MFIHQMNVVFHHKAGFLESSQLLFMFQDNENVEMKQFFVKFGMHLDDNNRLMKC